MNKTAVVIGALVAAFVATVASAADGTVKKVDDSAGKITLDHGPIKNLGMD